MKETEKLLKKYLTKEKIIILGLSAGVDSLVLFHLVKKILPEIKIVIAHVNHHLRKEALEEEKYLEYLAHKNDAYFEKKDIYLEGSSLEEKGRKERYEFFEELLNKYKAHYLLTAHHKDDLMETILMRLLRGSNLRGYQGINLLTKRADYYLFRPLLNLSKDELRNYAKINNIKYYEDMSNYDTKYFRNRIRKISGELKKENGEVLNHFLSFSNKLREVNDFVEKEILKVYEEVVINNKINLDSLDKYDYFLQEGVIRIYLANIYSDDITLLNDNHIKLILKLIKERNGTKRIDLPLYIGERSYSTFMVKKKEKLKDKKINKLLLKPNLEFNGYIFKEVKEEDKDTFRYLKSTNLYVRVIEKKDTMKLVDGGNSQVAKIFINEKVPRLIRPIYPLVVNEQNEIVWIPNIKKAYLARKYSKCYDTILKCIEEVKNNEEKN